MNIIIFDISTKSFRLENDLAEFYGLTGPLLFLVVVIHFDFESRYESLPIRERLLRRFCEGAAMEQDDKVKDD